MKSKSNQKGITLIALVLIIVGVVLLVGILLSFMSKKDKAPNNSQVGTDSVQQESNEFVYEMEDGSKLNVSKEMQKEKTVGNLKISNIQLKETNGITTLLADVENIGKEESQEKILQIQVIDKNGNEITTIRCPVDSVKSGEKVQLNTAITANIANAYDFRVNE